MGFETSVFLLLRKEIAMLSSTMILEIRAAEGGQDAKLILDDMVGIYAKACVLDSL